MSLGQCVVQWEGAFGVLVSGGWGSSVLFSVYGSSQCAVQCTWGPFNVLFSGGDVQCIWGDIQCDVDWFDLVQPASSHSYCGLLSAMALSCSEDTTCIYFKHLGYISQQKTSMNILKIC